MTTLIKTSLGYHLLDVLLMYLIEKL